ncbi:Uncharacterised protein [Vibrio cholerae]|nr:Uncharacterised protein [Vibrio cholerae]
MPRISPALRVKLSESNKHFSPRCMAILSTVNRGSPVLLCGVVGQYLGSALISALV